MDDLNKYSILYTPDLKPDKSYESDAKFNKSLIREIPKEDYIENLNYVPDNIKYKRRKKTPSDLVSSLSEINDLLILLPPRLSFIKETLFDPIVDEILVTYPDNKFFPDDEDEKPKDKPKDFITPPTPHFDYPTDKDDEITPDDDDDKTKEKIVYEDKPKPPSYDEEDIPENEINDYDELDFYQPELPDEAIYDLMPKPRKLNINVGEIKTIPEMIQDDYIKNHMDLIEYFTRKLQLVVQDYIQNVLTAMNEVGLDNIRYLYKEFDGDAVQVPPDQDLEHCRDYIIKSQLLNKQRNSLFQKVHTPENTLSHFRYCDVATQQRKRYYGEKQKPGNTFLEVQSNQLLNESKQQYNLNYHNALLNMYKYLNSSVIFTDEILKGYKKEIFAKCMLLKSGVNIFETKEVASSTQEV